jgi:hypothetical protein
MGLSYAMFKLLREWGGKALQTCGSYPAIKEYTAIRKKPQGRRPALKGAQSIQFLRLSPSFVRLPRRGGKILQWSYPIIHGLTRVFNRPMLLWYNYISLI